MKRLPLAAMMTAGIVMTLFMPKLSVAHCDTMDGPVINDAKQALNTANVEHVLKWIAHEDEEQIQQAFQRTLEVRAMGGEAKELADRWFFETLVRIHRASENAPYTGLKPAGSVDNQAILMADKALAQGSVDEFARKIAQHTEQAVNEKFEQVQQLAKNKDASPAAGREWVKAYVQYIHFVEKVAAVVHGHDEHGAEPGTMQSRAE